MNRALGQRPESPSLVVATTALQLGLVVLVWLVALVPAALAALTLLLIKTASGVFRPASVKGPIGP